MGKPSRQNSSSKTQRTRTRVTTTGKREQPRKDSDSKRINFDNERVSKLVDHLESCKSNDPIWYARSPEMMQSANLGFNTVTGLTTNSQGVAAPGVAVFNWCPTVGSDNTAVNQAANSKYSFIVHANSRNQSYDATDLMIMILAGKEVFCEIAELIRAYGIMQMYDQRNRYLPNALLTAAGFNAADLRANYSHMLWDINNLIAQASQIWVPDDMPIITREFWMCSHIYMDSESVKGQYYLYNKMFAFKFSATGSPSGSSLQLVATQKWQQHTLTWSAAVARVQEMINALIVQQDRGIMFGDILKAYGEARIYRLNQISANYTVQPVYDPEVLSQMSNVHYCDCHPTSVQQSTGVIFETWDSNPGTNASQLFASEGVLNLHVKGQPTPEAIMVATRLMALGNVFTASGQPLALTSQKPFTSGTESVHSISMCCYVNSGLVWNTYRSNIVLGSTASADILTRLFLASSFDWFPPMYTATSSGITLPTPDNPTAILHPYQFIMDMENYIWLDMQTLARIHTTALLSEFGVPVNLQ